MKPSSTTKERRTRPKPAPAAATPPQLPASSPLAGFSTLEEYHLPRGKTFPTLNSLRWFISENREELLEADAIRQHRGRLHLHDDRTDRIVDKVGKESAERRFRGNADVLSESIMEPAP